MAQYLSQPRIEQPIWLEPSESSFLISRLAEAKTHLETLEDQLKQADDAPISELTHQRDVKLVQIASIHNILSPIRRIPVEILSRILELSCSPVDGVFFPSYDVVRELSMVSYVCMAWRQAIHANPRMWSKLCLSIRDRPDIFMDNGARITEWISRSQGIPLELYLDLRVREYPTETFINRATQFLEAVFDFHDRIRLISLLGFHSAFRPLFHPPRFSLPLLEKLYLDMHFRGGVEIFTEAPRLQHLSIGNPEGRPILGPLLFSAEQLTSLEIKLTLGWHRGIDLSVYEATLCRCKSLVSLTIDLSNHVKAGFGDHLSICLPVLKLLDISCLDVSKPCVTLLHGLTTPLLEDMTLRWMDQDIHEFTRDVVGLQNRSGTELSSLTLILKCACDSRNAEIISENLISILILFSAVKSFRFSTAVDQSPNPFHLAYDANPLMQALTRTSQSFLLPKLTDFELSVSSYPSELASMVRSRWSADAQLQKITLPQGWSDQVTFSLPGLAVDFH